MQNILKTMRRVAATATTRPLAKLMAGSSGLAISVIMATRNKATYLDLTLASLERQLLLPEAWEVVVVDDESSDGTSAVLDKYENRKQLHLVRRHSARCRGRAGARNDAMDVAGGQIAVFLDDDRLVGPDFLLRHLAHHMNSDCVVLGDIHRSIQTHVSPLIDRAMWNLASLFRRRNIHPLNDTAIERIVETEDLEHPARLEILTTEETFNNYQLDFAYFHRKKVECPLPHLYFTTGNASVARKQVLTVGGFDEAFRGWGLEDHDLAYRLHLAGLPFHFEPKAYTLHQIHLSDPHQKADLARNLKYLFHKYPSLSRAEMEPLLLSKDSVVAWFERKRQRGSVNTKTLLPSLSASILRAKVRD